MTIEEEIRAQGYVLTPGAMWSAAELEEDDEPFKQKDGAFDEGIGSAV
ncbi:MAG: hypothetical protein U0Z26_12335 [Anaerolineales bacterium]